MELLLLFNYFLITKKASNDKSGLLKDCFLIVQRNPEIIIIFSESFSV